MTRPGRKLSPEEADLWARVAETVTPIEGGGRSVRTLADNPDVARSLLPRAAAKVTRSAARSNPAAPVSKPRHVPDSHGLDSSWDKKLTRGIVQPDFTLDLHGATLDAAHGRLMHGLTQAKAVGARVILLVTGKPRPVESADRTSKRGAIRAKVMDWLAHSEHALDIAAVRNAHRRHGGQGALYIILKRRR